MKKHLLFISFFIFFGKNLLAQESISLKNASFEWGTAIANAIPPGWGICGGRNETPPDVHSAKTRHYGVKGMPKKGDKFIGLVVRSNFTYESIHQKLKSPLQKGKTYEMDMYVAMSNTFKSHDAVTMKEVLFNKPAIIRIWGVEKICETKELLFESEPIDNLDWEKLSITFTPTMDHERIMFEAFYDKMVEGEYNGNVLLDGISDIKEKIENDKE